MSDVSENDPASDKICGAAVSEQRDDRFDE